MKIPTTIFYSLIIIFSSIMNKPNNITIIQSMFVVDPSPSRVSETEEWAGPTWMENDQSSCFDIAKSGKEEVFILNFNPTILELDMNCVFLDHDKHALCDRYVVEFVHDATENYYERGKYGCRNFHVTKTPLFLLKILKLHLFCFLCLAERR